MAQIPTTNVSMAAINTEVGSVNSHSLKTLSDNATSGSDPADGAPYGMGEFRGYIHEEPVNLDGAIWATAISFGLSGSCSAYFIWFGSGLISTQGFGNPGQSSTNYDWLASSSSASDYQVRFTWTSTIGSGGNINGSFKNGTTIYGSNSTSGPPTSGVWYDADKYHQFKAYDSGSDPTDTSVTGTVDIRDSASQTILATKGFSVLADQEP